MSSRGSLGSFPGRIWENSRAHCRSLHFASLRSKNISREGPLTPQISPLRCAPVEMTKGRATLPATVVAEQDPFFIALGGPKAHDSSGRDDQRKGSLGGQLAAADERHVGGHDGHELDIRF